MFTNDLKSLESYWPLYDILGENPKKAGKSNINSSQKNVKGLSSQKSNHTFGYSQGGALKFQLNSEKCKTRGIFQAEPIAIFTLTKRKKRVKMEHY